MTSAVEGFQLEVSGYSEKAPLLLLKIIEKISKFEIPEDRFQVIKEEVPIYRKFPEISINFFIIENS